jgi:23S rRNA (uracil1939-C5)-methyltransferase
MTSRADTVEHCPHAERCPGCPLIAEPYASGLGRKAARLERALARYGHLGSSSPEPAQPAEQSTNYRVRAKLVTDDRGRLGLFAAGGHDVIDIPGCRVLDPRLQAVAAALRALLPLEVRLVGVDLRACDRGVLVCLILDGPAPARALESSRQRLIAALPQLAGLAFSVHRPGAVQLLGHELQILDGNAAEPHHLAPDQPWHYASHGAFTQVHPAQAVRLHERLERALEARFGALAGRRILELYAGSGALALRLAARGAELTAVDAFAPALDRCASAAAAQHLRVVTEAASAEEFLARAPGAARFDAVIVNPPRRGLSPAVRRALGELGAELIVYISCEPATLARDLGQLALYGWQATLLVPFDLIPLSGALEVLAVLSPRPPPAPRVLYEDAQSVALFKLPFEPTTPQGESKVSLLERARRELGVPELTPIHRLDQGTSGVCWFARRPADVAPLARALELGEKTYVALAHGVTHPRGKIDRPLREAGKNQSAVTRYRRREVIGGHSLLELQPEHGRKHQLRRHLNSIGHAILGDERYGKPSANRHFEHRHGLDRPFLHCARVRLALPGGPVEVEAELAGDLAAVLDSLRGAAELSPGFDAGAVARPAQIGKQHAGGDGDVE